MVYEYACHEGNYAMSNILSGERSKEKSEAGAEESSKSTGRRRRLGQTK